MTADTDTAADYAMIATGQVGIGVSDPEEALEVSGKIKAADFEFSSTTKIDMVNDTMSLEVADLYVTDNYNGLFTKTATVNFDVEL